MSRKTLSFVFLSAAVLGFIGVLMAQQRSTLVHAQSTLPLNDPRLKMAYRFQQDGWTYMHLEGKPYDIGFQHGYFLAPEIEDAFKAVQLENTHSTQREWTFF